MVKTTRGVKRIKRIDENKRNARKKTANKSKNLRRTQKAHSSVFIQSAMS